MKIVHRPGNKHGNADAMSRLTELPKELCKQCKMPDNYMYQGPTEVDVPCMKEGQQDEKIQAVSDEEVLEVDIESESPNLFPNNGSNSGLDDSNVADGTPILRRGRKVNRPVPAKQRPRPKLNLNYATLRKEQEGDSVIGKILKLKESNAEKPENEIIAESPELKFWLSRWEILEVLEAFKNTNDPQPTSDTELESESGAELESGKNTKLGSGSSAELESGKDAELGSGSGAELGSGNDAELRSGTKSAIIINRNESRFGRSIKKTEKLKDYIQNLRMDDQKSVICRHCGKLFASVKSLKRHENQRHRNIVKVRK